MKQRIRFLCCFLLVVLLFAVSGCQKTGDDIDPEHLSDRLVYDHRMELEYADQFQVDYYKDGYALITLADASAYLVVPEEQEVPKDLPEKVVVLQQPLTNGYLVASAVMDMYVKMDALDALRFTGTKAEDWYIEEAKQAMEQGELLYAGRYAAPDYETILSADCRLAIENTMIYHTPEVKEKLESFGIPVFVDHSSYEKEPFGRMEWIRLYGILCQKEEQAEQIFAKQLQLYEQAEQIAQAGTEKKECKTAFFYITANGAVNIRRPSDYIAKMIKMAGGSYVFDYLQEEEEEASSTMTMQLEEFYQAAADADLLIYNSTIDGELHSVKELLDKCPVLADVKAVKEGRVYCTSQNMYQSSMELGEIYVDLSRVIHQKELSELKYIFQLEGEQQ